MTFFYFVNCCALSYGPYFLMYKKSVLSEYQPYRVSLVGALVSLLSCNHYWEVVVVWTFWYKTHLQGCMTCHTSETSIHVHYDLFHVWNSFTDLKMASMSEFLQKVININHFLTKFEINFIEMYVNCVDISDDNDSSDVSARNFGAPGLPRLGRARHLPVPGRGHWPLRHLLRNQSNSWQTNYQGTLTLFEAYSKTF